MGLVAVDQLPFAASQVGGLFVSMALIYLLAFLTILDASELDFRTTRESLMATSLPLLVTFFGIVLLSSLRIILS